MHNQLKYYLIAIFSVFLGSQITEGFLLIPYWQSLSAVDFYTYYQDFGPEIGLFYTILTITAALIPIAVTIYKIVTKSSQISFSLLSSLFAILFVACFISILKEQMSYFINQHLTKIN